MDSTPTPTLVCVSCVLCVGVRGGVVLCQLSVSVCVCDLPDLFTAAMCHVSRQ